MHVHVHVASVYCTVIIISQSTVVENQLQLLDGNSLPARLHVVYIKPLPCDFKSTNESAKFTVDSAKF